MGIRVDHTVVQIQRPQPISWEVVLLEEDGTLRVLLHPLDRALADAVGLRSSPTVAQMLSGHGLGEISTC